MMSNSDLMQHARVSGSARWADTAIDPPAQRIGVVIHDFALGGSERIAVRLASQWAADGADVTLFAGSGEGPLAALLDPRVHLVSPAEPIRRRWRSQRALAAAAARHFAARPVDVCFVPGNYHWPVAEALGRIPAAVRPAIAAQLSSCLRKPQRGRLRQIIFNARMRRLLRFTDALVTLSPRANQEADAVLRRAASVAIAIPALEDATTDACPLAPARGRMILAAGRLDPAKGFEILIEAFSQLVHGGRAEGAELVIVGEGPERPRLTRLIRERGLDGRVSMPGYAQDIRPWLDKARMFVLSSRFEGYAAVIVEALAAGRPVITTRCTPAVDELLRGTGAGLDVPIDDPTALAGAIDAMFDAEVPDPARLAALVDHYRIGPVARDYADLFRQIAANRRHAVPSAPVVDRRRVGNAQTPRGLILTAGERDSPAIGITASAAS